MPTKEQAGPSPYTVVRGDKFQAIVFPLPDASNAVDMSGEVADDGVVLELEAAQNAELAAAGLPVELWNKDRLTELIPVAQREWERGCASKGIPARDSGTVAPKYVLRGTAGATPIIGAQESHWYRKLAALVVARELTQEQLLRATTICTRVQVQARNGVASLPVPVALSNSLGINTRVTAKTSDGESFFVFPLKALRLNERAGEIATFGGGAEPQDFFADDWTVAQGARQERVEEAARAFENGIPQDLSARNAIVVQRDGQISIQTSILLEGVGTFADLQRLFRKNMSVAEDSWEHNGVLFVPITLEGAIAAAVATKAPSVKTDDVFHPWAPWGFAALANGVATELQPSEFVEFLAATSTVGAMQQSRRRLAGTEEMRLVQEQVNQGALGIFHR